MYNVVQRYSYGFGPMVGFRPFQSHSLTACMSSIILKLLRSQDWGFSVLLKLNTPAHLLPSQPAAPEIEAEAEAETRADADAAPATTAPAPLPTACSMHPHGHYCNNVPVQAQGVVFRAPSGLTTLIYQ